MSTHISNHARTTLIHNPSFKRHGMKNYVRALRKFNIGPTVPGPYTMVVHMEQRGLHAIRSKVRGRAHVAGHVLRKKSGASGQTGRVPAQDVEQNAEYLAPVSIGTPAQTLNLDFDTGSSDLWVFSTELPASDKSTTGDAPSHNVFDPSKSSTWQPASGSTWNISYGDNSSASGDVGTDNISIGGLLIKNQAVELAKTLSPEFAQGAGDGLCGLAWGVLNTVQPHQVATPVENMITQQDIPKTSELFTCWLDNTEGNSWYTFGVIDKAALGDVTPSYTPVDNSNGFWQFASGSASVNGETVDRTGNTAIADTGTTLCLVDDNTCQAVYGAIPGAKQDPQQQGWVFPTDTPTSALPTIELAVGTTLFTLNPADLAFQDLKNGFTYGGIQSRGDQSFDIFGDVFLRCVYAIFDQGNMQFGCVQRTPGETATASGSKKRGHPCHHREVGEHARM